jgi:hypothetical protein
MEFVPVFFAFRTVSWNRDVPSDKMSFTMRREIDKQREESELLKQLRIVSERIFF